MSTGDEPKDPKDEKMVSDTISEPSAGASGSVDVAVSSSELTAAGKMVSDTISEPSPGASGSVDVSLATPDPDQTNTAIPVTASSATAIPAAASSATMTPATATPAAATAKAIPVTPTDSAVPQPIGASDSQPASASGAVRAVAAADRTGPVKEGTGPVRAGRAKRVTAAMSGAFSGGVERLGEGIGVVGEAVSKVGDLTNKVPLVGAGVGKLGEGLTKAGESIQLLPTVAKTRRGRLLVRSVVVGFLLVFVWITAIVWFQLRAHNTPDFRPDAEQLLVELSKGPASIAEIYEHASPRFQELVNKETFIDTMKDLKATNGKFREITAINETIVTTGPTGRVGRVGLTASYEKGISKGSISFHWDKGEWKLLGIGIEVPENVMISQAERQKRVAACLDDNGKDVSDMRTKCPVRDAAETILENIRDGRAGEVWDDANAVFKQQESRQRFIQIQNDVREQVGAYKRILDVTSARSIGGLTAAFDVVCEFEKSSGVRVELDFKRTSQFERWQLARFKVTLPMPRANDGVPEGSGGSAMPSDAGVGGG